MDAGHAAAVISAQFPELAPVRAAFLGAGCDSEAFDVNAEWVFRFPVKADVEAQLLTELRVLPALKPRLPLPIPDYRFRGRPSSLFPRHFVGYRKMPGVPAVMLDPRQVPFASVARAIAAFLAALHAFPVDEASLLGVEHQPIERLIDEVRADAVGDFEMVKRVAPQGAPVQAWRAYLEAPPPSAIAAAPVLLHNDFAAEHILINPETHAITGVIDWSDLAIGHPVADFAGVFHWDGKPFLDAVVSDYTPGLDQRLIDVVRFLAACRGAGDVAFGIERRRPEYVTAGLRALADASGAGMMPA